ncbi:MAG TPA: protein-methionine-sulfoxide reductase catalytic subunit MsrP [Candidatus Angelobacter sp.]|jgi:sulfoxide reductase catalytic subunit YedY|nr:protein-methionine-sulfoxide reductase catalytic subunit MsrP [Candidatus Angelobacter sp.]
MLIKKPNDIPTSEITSKSTYMDRRKFIAGAAATGATLVTGLYLGDAANKLETVEASTKLTGITKSQFSTSEKPNSLKDIANYNNYYEFSTDKYEPNGLSRNFRSRPWTVAVEGLVAKPKKMDIDEIMKLAPLEERIYRFRCVEGWSMVIPWVGFPLSALIKQVEPLSKARFVAFETILAPSQMPGQNHDVLLWPYVEGLRMDEAMHPLSILAVGIYDEVLPNVDGAPIRLVVPWKYGFKSIKAIVKIKFVEKAPPTSWNRMAPNEYGFYSNVNPQVDHPRWSQAKERRIGEFFKRETLMLNGYGDQVASLYSGMDLRKNF